MNKEKGLYGISSFIAAFLSWANPFVTQDAAYIPRLGKLALDALIINYLVQFPTLATVPEGA